MLSPQSNSLRTNTIRSDLWLIIKIVAVTILTIAMFFNDLTILFNDAFQNEMNSYMLAIPFIFTYMLYRKRKVLSATALIENSRQTTKTHILQTIAGFLTIITSILLYWYGSYTFTPLEYHMMILPVFIVGLILIFFNLQTLRQLFFPIIYLAFLIPPPTQIFYTIGSSLSNLSSTISYWLVQIIGIPSIIYSEYGTPAILITRADGTQLPFIVDIACSGIYSLLGFLVFALLIVYIIRDKLWKKITLITIGIIIVYALNVIRITTILIIGYHYGEDLALQIFHLLGGWVLNFIGTLLLLGISEKLFKTKIFNDAPEKCLECATPNEETKNSCTTCARILKPKKIQIHKSDFLKIVATITIVMLFMSIHAPVFAMTQTPANIIVNTPTGTQVSTEIFPTPTNYQLYFNSRDSNFEQISQQDMALSYIYYPEKANLEPIWVNLEIASTRSSLHRWEVCLYNNALTLGQLPRVDLIELTDIPMSENPPIISRYFAFNDTKTNQTQAVLYWYEIAIFNINSTSQQKNVKISLIGYPESIEDLNSTKTQQIIIAKAIIDYWEPIKLWSATAMLISNNGSYLASITSFFLFVTALYYAFETKRQRNADLRAYKKLSLSDQKLITAIQNVDKKTIPTLSAIAAELQTTSQIIDKDQLLQKIVTLEKERIIESRILNCRDEPLQTWKAQKAKESLTTGESTSILSKIKNLHWSPIK